MPDFWTSDTKTARVSINNPNPLAIVADIIMELKAVPPDSGGKVLTTISPVNIPANSTFAMDFVWNFAAAPALLDFDYTVAITVIDGAGTVLATATGAVLRLFNKSLTITSVTWS